MQGTTQIPRFGAKIVTVDTTQGLIEAVFRGDQSRKISVHTTPTAFRWPVVGEDWIVEQKNGSWYLEALWPPLGIAQNPVTAVTNGVSLTVNPPNVQSGGLLQVAWSNVTAPTSRDWFGAFPVGTGDSNSNFNPNWAYTNGTQGHGGSALETGTISLIAPTQPGAYEIRLSANDSSTLIASTPFSVHATTLHDVEAGDAVINTPTNTVHVLGSEDGVTDFSITQDQLVAPETLRSNNAALTTTDIPSVGQGLTWQGLTGGNWVSHVGTDGYILFGWNAGADVVSLPAGVTESDTVSRATWANVTSDARALTNAAQTQRNAATAYANDDAGNPKDYTITFDCPSGYTGLVSIYCLDWDASDRSQAVSINAGGVGGTHIISNFTNGAWIQEAVDAHGPLTITFKCLTGPNAVVSGIFFGGSTTQGYQPTNIVKTGDTAGGDLSGTYPNPTVTHVLSGQTPVSTSTALGGELSGTLPNPTLATLRTILTGVAQNTTPFSAVAGKIHYCTGAITGTLPSAPVADAECGFVATNGVVTVNRSGSDTISDYKTGLTTVSVPAGTSVIYKYLSGVWYPVRDSRGFGWYSFAEAGLSAQYNETGTGGTVHLDARRDDPNNLWNLATFFYTCPVAGIYDIDGQFVITEQVATNNWTTEASILRNGTITRLGNVINGSGLNGQADLAPVVSGKLRCAAGDTLGLGWDTFNATAPILSTQFIVAQDSTYLAVQRIG